MAADSIAMGNVELDRNRSGGRVRDDALDIRNGIEFISDPPPKATEISGLLSGRLDVISNKKDFDFEIDLYELTPKGKFVQLAPYWTRGWVGSETRPIRWLQPTG